MFSILRPSYGNTIGLPLRGMLSFLLYILLFARGVNLQRCEDLGTGSHAECISESRTVCEPGWVGQHCNVPVCKPGCNLQHGYCNQPGECKCALGWKGEYCDECLPLPGCQHGSCNTTNFECHCDPGWNGIMCTQPICKEACHPTQGYCDLPGECKCRIGWEGPSCSSCVTLPGCVQGTCHKPFECRCHPGWQGVFCQRPICSQGCSPEHGTCENPGECRCTVGWWGDRCTECFPYPGCIHGYCQDPWQCICHPGWKGMLCDQPADDTLAQSCPPGACLNGGTCRPEGRLGNFTCVCPPLFTGHLCDYLASPSARDATIDGARSPSSDFEGLREDQFLVREGVASSGLYSLVQLSTPSTHVKGKTEAIESPLRGSSALSAGEVQTSSNTNSTGVNRARVNSTWLSFRQPKIIQSDGSSERPYTIIERKLLPLPVVLPRVRKVLAGEGDSEDRAVPQEEPKNTGEDEENYLTKGKAKPKKNESNTSEPSGNKSNSKPSKTGEERFQITDYVLNKLRERFDLPSLDLSRRKQATPSPETKRIRKWPSVRQTQQERLESREHSGGLRRRLGNRGLTPERRGTRVGEGRGSRGGDGNRRVRERSRTATRKNPQDETREQRNSTRNETSQEPPERVREVAKEEEEELQKSVKITNSEGAEEKQEENGQISEAEREIVRKILGTDTFKQPSAASQNPPHPSSFPYPSFVQERSISPTSAPYYTSTASIFFLPASSNLDSTTFIPPLGYVAF
ncbi:uncharacterized protein LOC143021540 [Oratosquilla oratoria]|uniref:uncharacterized protein LOC143021540 n=1 Tax=Oratosquilla oratoria TaxID=337810 RepID=UPI003F75C741